MRRHADVAGLALHHFQRRAPETASELQLVLAETGDLGAAGAEGERIGADGDGDLRHPVAALLHRLQDPPAVLARFRVDADAAALADLAAVGADVRAEFRIRGDHGRDVDVAATVRRIVLQPGELLDVHLVAAPDDFLAGRAIRPDLDGRDAAPGAAGFETPAERID